MIGFTVFDVVNGFQCQHYFRLVEDGKGQRFPIAFLEDQVKLRNDELILSRKMAPIYLACRSGTEHGVLTWVGKYSPLPSEYADREGSYFGVGIWFLDMMVLAADLTDFVEKIDRTLRELMKNSKRSAWDVKALKASQLGISPRQTDEIAAKERRTTGFGIDGAERSRLGFCVVGSAGELNLAIDQICFGPPNPEISRVIVARDLEAAAAFRRSPYAVEIKIERASAPGARAFPSSQPGAVGDVVGRGRAAVPLQPRWDRIEGPSINAGRMTGVASWISVAAATVGVAAAFFSWRAEVWVENVAENSGQRNPSITEPAGPAAAGPSPAASAKGGDGDAQAAGGQVDFQEKPGAKLLGEPRGDVELAGLVSNIDSLLRRKDVGANAMLRSSLEKARDEAKKQIESLKGAALLSPPQLK